MINNDLEDNGVFKIQQIPTITITQYQCYNFILNNINT
jgi:hypothetical protein